jgi:hypothetical protein
LEAINALAQLVAAIGVIVSLFYLAAQIRQNTRSMRAVVVDSLAHSLVDPLGPRLMIRSRCGPFRLSLKTGIMPAAIFFDCQNRKHARLHREAKPNWRNVIFSRLLRSVK